MTPEELERAARLSGSTDLSGPEPDPCGPPRWVGVLTLLVIAGTLWIGWQVLMSIVREFISVHEMMVPKL